MKKTILILELVVLAFLSVSCSTTAYVPKLSLEASHQKINKNVKIEPFVDSTPIKDRKNPLDGSAVPAKQNYNGNLSNDITLAVAVSFDNNNLFTNAKTEIENPDYIIKGEIIKFRGYVKSNNYSKFALLSEIAGITLSIATGNITYLWVGSIPFGLTTVGIPTTKTASEVLIVLNVYDKNNNLIKSYTGKAMNKTDGDVYSNLPSATANDLNQTFSNAVKEIREQILNDRNLY